MTPKPPPRIPACTPPADPGSAAVVAHAAESSSGACIPCSCSACSAAQHSWDVMLQESPLIPTSGDYQRWLAGRAVCVNLSQASGSSSGACIPLAPSQCSRGGSSVSIRPISALFEAVLGKDGFQAQVQRRTEYSKDAARFSLTLLRAVNKAYRLQTVGQFHKLLESIQRGVSVYLSALVRDRDGGVLRSSEFPLSAFYGLDDCLVVLVRFDAVNQFDAHLSLSAVDLQRLYYVREYVSVVFGGRA